MASQNHHLTPLAVARVFGRFYTAIGYDIDSPSNILSLPTSVQQNGNAVHLRPHPRYSLFVGGINGQVAQLYYATLRNPATAGQAVLDALQNMTAAEDFLRG